jgi:hypothetical protein
LQIPHLVTAQKNWFVYLNLTYNHSHSASNISATVPTPAERTGDFSGATVNGNPVSIFDPLSGAPFPGNIIPTSRINPAALVLMKYYPQQLYPGLVQNYSTAIASPSNGQSLGLRLTGPVTSKDTLTINQQYSGNNSLSEGNIFGFTDVGGGYGLSSSVGWRHVFKPRFNNSATLTFSRNIAKTTPFFAYGQNVAAELGITGTDQSPVDYGPPNLSFTNFTGLSDTSYSNSRSAPLAQLTIRIRLSANAEQLALLLAIARIVQFRRTGDQPGGRQRERSPGHWVRSGRFSVGISAAEFLAHRQRQ